MRKNAWKKTRFSGKHGWNHANLKFWQKIILSSDSISSTHRFLQISRVRLTRRVRVTRNSRRPEQGNALIRKKKRSAESREQSASWTLTIVDKILLSWSEIVGFGWSIDLRSRSSAISSILDANDRSSNDFTSDDYVILFDEDESTEFDLYPMSKESERFLREQRSELKKKKKLILSMTMVPERISVNHCSAFRSIRVRGSGLTFELTDSYSARVRE